MPPRATPARSATPADAPIHEIKAELFRAIGHPVRIRLLELLTTGERPVSDLLAETGLEASHLSQHLAVLRRTGLVQARREGNAVHYRLSHPSVVDLLDAARTFLLSTLSSTRDVLTGLEQEHVDRATGANNQTATNNQTGTNNQASTSSQSTGNQSTNSRVASSTPKAEPRR